MIIETNTGKGFKGCVEYNYTKVENGQAEVLCSNGLSDENSQNQVSRDFNIQAGGYRSSHLEQTVIHTSINFSPDDRKISNEEMKKIAEDYLKQRGLEKTQYVIIRHTDRGHQHCHIIANRVMDENKLFDLKFYKQRDYQLERVLEKKYELINAAEIKQQDLKINADRLRMPDRLKYDVRMNLENCLQKANNINEFSELLKEKNINFSYVYSNQREGKIVGCKFERDGYSISPGSIKQSNFHKRLQEKFFDAAINKNISATQSFSESNMKRDVTKLQIKQAIEKHLPSSKNINELIAKLKQEGINAKVVTNAEGKIVGIKFEKNGMQLNGSSVGKQYSYGALKGRIERAENFISKPIKNSANTNRADLLMTKSAIIQAVKSNMYGCRSVEDLKEKLKATEKAFGVKMVLIRDKSDAEIVKGIQFYKDGIKVTGSELGREFSYQKLQQQIEKMQKEIKKIQRQEYNEQYYHSLTY